MRTQLCQKARLPESKGVIAPYELWAKLSTCQQQHVYQTLTSVVQQRLARLSDIPLSEGKDHEYNYQSIRDKLRPEPFCQGLFIDAGYANV